MAKKRRGPTRPQPEAAPKAKELMKLGWCRRDAEHLLVVELALSMAGTLSGEALAVLAKHASTALKWEPVRCGALALYDEAEHAAAWRALAAEADAESRELLLHLAAHADGRQVMKVDPAEAFTAEDLRLTEEARQAEARGDLEEALRLLGTCTRPLDDGWAMDLEKMVREGDQLPPAVWGRWICSAALRWCQTTRRGLELGQHYAGIALRACGAPEEVVAEHAMSRAGYDQVVHDALLWDEGGLAEYVARDLAPAVADRVPGLATWPDARLRVLCLLGAEGDDAVCEDVLTAERIIIGDDRLAAQHPPGRLFVGRVVRVDGDARQFFAMKPTICEDAMTAIALAELLEAGGDAEERIDLQHRSLTADAA
jgi:hypothetical protein